MKKQFKITGFYYSKQGFKFRKYLDIKKINSTLIEPDLMVVMMNPGSSRPLDGIDNNNKASEAVPDNTQSQIMKIMLNAGFNYARVLNLSDLREAKSKIFYEKIPEMEAKGISHSIFDANRIKELNNLWVNDVPVIYGWGVSTKLKSLALQAISVCKVIKPHGILKPNTIWAYYHPLPPNHHKQIEWVNKIKEQFKF